MIRLLLLIIASSFVHITAGANELTWYDGSKAVTYCLETHTSPVVDVALGMLTSDLHAVTGRDDVLVKTKRDAMLRIIQLDHCSAKQRKLLASSGINMEVLSQMDAFFLGVNQGSILAVGNNGRGVAYALLELSRQAGVSPWIWWADNAPIKRNRLTLPDDFSVLHAPSVKYRGIFLNDEDWSLRLWSGHTFEQGNPYGMIGSKTYKEVFKLLLRLRANMIWPAMHELTTPFYMVPGAKEIADSCAIFIGTSHCEPLMRNNAGEWNVAKRGAYNYITNRDEVQRYWTERLQQVAGSDNVYTIGMRGIHDGSMEGVKTMQEKTDALQMVINDQRKMLAKYVNKDVASIPQAFVPYKEVLNIMENGLQVPNDVTLIWCDDNYGYMTRLSDEAQQKRQGGAGVYYHLSYWGRPHDWLWLTTMQPGLMYNEMMEAYRHNARREWIVNVHDLKPASYHLELFLDMAWDINSVSPSTLEHHLGQWLCREFGTEAGKRLLPIMTEYYRLTGIRKPEHMGWTQVELDRRVYPRGRSQVRDTEFSFSEFDEAERYMSDYARLEQEVRAIEQTLPVEKRDAYFSHIKYKVCCAAAMAQKMLEAQRARSYSMGQSDSTLYSRNDMMQLAAARSISAYREIQQLTDFYNREMAGGRWNMSMTYRPRDLYVFDPPTLPIGLSDKEVETIMRCHNAAVYQSRPLIPDDSYVARNACDYQQAGQGVQTVQMLGHSMRAVCLPKGQQLTYTFDTEREGDAMLRLAFIPTQPNDRGDLRYQWQLDEQQSQTVSINEPNRNDKWKQNVMRGQDLRSFPIKLSKGKHTLRIIALDNHIVMDQWMVDFQPRRSFYVLPVSQAK